MRVANVPSSDPATPCPERARLEKDHDDVTIAFENARAVVQARIGISSKDEYVRLERAAGEAWTRLERVRRAIEGHIRDHGCKGHGAKSASRTGGS
jgi:hypothetical protein